MSLGMAAWETELFRPNRDLSQRDVPADIGQAEISTAALPILERSQDRVKCVNAEEAEELGANNVRASVSGSRVGRVRNQEIVVQIAPAVELMYQAQVAIVQRSAGFDDIMKVLDARSKVGLLCVRFSSFRTDSCASCARL